MRWLEVWPPGCRGAAGPGEEGEPRERGGERRGGGGYVAAAAVVYIRGEGK